MTVDFRNFWSMIETVRNKFAHRVRHVRTWISILLGAGLVVWLLSRVTIDELVDGLTGAEIGYVAASLLMRFAANAVRTVRYHYFFSVIDRWLELYGPQLAFRHGYRG